jgi:tRNA-specific 2-thiouridylase
VVGVTLRQIPRQLETETLSTRWRINVQDARYVAEHLGIVHEVADLSEVFQKEVVDPFVAAYRSGQTPNPCFRCNPRVKFRKGLELADRLGAARMATGHHARIIQTAQRPRLAAGVDRAKDQSYFLAGVPAELLERVYLPIGELTKDQVRAIAREHHLPVAEKEESQEICFTTEGNVHTFLAAQENSTEGEIVDSRGTVLGRHRGIAHYTVGQRRGLGLAGGPFYVKALDAAANRVIVGRHEELFARDVSAVDANYLVPVEEGNVGWAKIRSRHPAAACTVVRVKTDSFTVRFAEPQWGVAPGQALVLYDGDYVVAGGVIAGWVPA